MKRTHATAAIFAAFLGLVVGCSGGAFVIERLDGGGTSDGGGSGSSSGAGGSSSGSSSGATSSSSGGSSGSSSSGASSGGGSSSSGGCGYCSPTCPSQVPISGATGCSNSVCEYGSSPVQNCDIVATCTSNAWSVQSPSGTSCSGTRPPSCPATYSQVPRGTACSPASLVCDYVEGRCACGPGAGPIQLIDGAVADRWFCQAPSTAGCPQRRPPLGSTCTSEGLLCDYASCSVPGGSAETCKRAVWVETPVGCPL